MLRIDRLKRATTMLVAGVMAILLVACSCITVQPQSQTVVAGQVATFSVTISQPPSGVVVRYQWLRNGVPIVGATSSSYHFTAQLADNGARFNVVISGDGYSETSDTATLTVTAPPATATVGTISILAGQLGGFGNLNGTGAAARLGRPTATAVDAQGNVYVADAGNNAVRKITSAGVVTTFAGSNSILGVGSTDGTGTVALFSGPSGIAIDTAGNLYVADTGNSTIRKITTAGVVSTIAGTAGVTGSSDGTGSSASFNSPQGITVDSAGNVYVADTGNYTIRKITPAGVVNTVAGTTGVTGSANGVGTNATFYIPQGITVDASGNLYVADTFNNMIRMITPAGVVTTLAGAPGVAGGSDGIGAAASFDQPEGIVVDTAGNLYVSDTLSQTIRKVSPSGLVTTIAGSLVNTVGSVVSTVAGLLGIPGSVDGSGTAARFDEPAGLSIDSNGNLYVADAGNAVVRQITPAAAVTTLAGKAPVLGSADGTGAAASFSVQASSSSLFAAPQLAVDSTGNVYVADTFNNTIRKTTPTGVVTTIAGTPGLAGSSDGTGAAASFSSPMGIAVDSAGNLYVVDTGNNSIRKITSGGVVSTLAGTVGIAGSADGTGASASFNSPQGIAVDGAGNLYVADTLSSTIRKISPAGVVTTLAGTAFVYGSTDGTGAAASFNEPDGIAVDSSGNVYVADTNNNTIRKITSAGVVTTLAGVAGTCGSADGTGSAANLCSPEAVTVDASGNIYVADLFNAALRKITSAGVVTTVAGQPGADGVVTGPVSTGSLDFVGGIAVDSSGALYTVSENALIKVTPGQSGGGTVTPPTPPKPPCQPCRKPVCCRWFFDCFHHLCCKWVFAPCGQQGH